VTTDQSPSPAASAAARDLLVLFRRLRGRIRQLAAGDLTPSQASVLARLTRMPHLSVRHGRGRRDGSRFDFRLLAPMIVGTTANPINSSIIAVSLVPIGRAFGAPTAQTAWLRT
jgi:hypothetical protein